MSTESEWTVTPIEPFGAIVQSKSGSGDLPDIPPETIKEWIDEYRMLLLRGFAALDGDEFPKYAMSLGQIQEWSFGAVNELKVQADSKNYLYTTSEVPFHWDGAFAGKI